MEEYDWAYNCLYEALILSTYSFYEKMLKRIVLSNKIDVLPQGNESKTKFYATTSICSIKAYCSLDKIDSMIKEIDDYRGRRNKIAHEEYEGFNKIDPSDIEDALGKIKATLIAVNEAVEAQKGKDITL